MYAIELFLWGRALLSHSLIRKKKKNRLFRDMCKSCDQDPSLTQGPLLWPWEGSPALMRGGSQGSTIGGDWGVLLDIRGKKSPYSENSPDLLWVHPICQHLASVT